MPQFLKDEVEQAITHAALRTFSTRGFRAASMAEIAREAGISAGNVYRYFENKQVLFDAVVPDALATRFLSLLRARVASTGQAGFADAAEALAQFTVAHRLELVIMLARAEGTAHEGLAEKVRGMLITMALAHFGVAKPKGPLAFALREVYAHFVSSMVNALAAHDDPRDARAAAETYTRYHWAGMKALFAEVAP